MARQINDEGLRLIEGFEGLYLHAYHGAADVPGLLTIGYGHTSEAGPPTVVAGQTITKQEADDILRADLSKVEDEVEKLVKVPLNDNQFAAIVSFTFNCGGGALAGSSLLRRLNAGNYASVPDSLMSWVNSNGRRQEGLVSRRQREGLLFMSQPNSIASNTVVVDDPDATAKQVQHELNVAGYGPLDEDGDIGDKTLKAIMKAIKKAETSPPAA